MYWTIDNIFVEVQNFEYFQIKIGTMRIAISLITFTILISGDEDSGKLGKISVWQFFVIWYCDC